GAGQASVIGRAADAVTGGSFGQLLDVPASLTVDDAAFAGVAADDLQDLGEHVVAWKRTIRQVGTVHVADQPPRPAQAQLRADVLLHLRRRRGRKGHARHLGRLVQHRAELAVFRTEVVPPVRDTVRLVDGEQRQLGPQTRRQVADHEPLRADVQHLELAGGRLAPDRTALALLDL